METERSSICQTTEDLLASKLFARIVKRFVKYLKKHNSVLLNIFGGKKVNEEVKSYLVNTLKMLGRSNINEVAANYPKAEIFTEDKGLLNNFVKGLYNYWLSLDRFLVCHSEDTGVKGEKFRPYRMFNETGEQLTHTVRAAYRDILENSTGDHPNIYHQAAAGIHIGLIAVKKEWPCPGGIYADLRSIPMIRQVLLNPPLIFDTPMNKRDGRFQKVATNPLEGWSIDTQKWLCYPAKVGPLLIHIFFHQSFMELGCSLANIFELAKDGDLETGPDAICMYGCPIDALSRYGSLPTVFFDDTDNDILVGAVPEDDEFGYFGYLKKMTLTLHNIAMMKQGRLPFHGALVRILIKDGKEATILIIGDTGAGKSETLEALRVVGSKHIHDMVIIADDMGSPAINPDGAILGYGTETGAFVRLDDLPKDYAFGQIDRAIIMNPHAVNARVVLPITTLAEVLKGYPIDIVLYANNYDRVDEECPIIERFGSGEEAIRVFRTGMVMAKGTTTASGIGRSYFANPFGPPQYKDIHDKLASEFFQAAFDHNIFVGQIRTRLGIPEYMTSGPEEAAKALLDLIS